MSDKVLVLGARQWTIEEEGRAAFSGVTVEFIEDYEGTNPRHHGISVQKVSADDTIFHALAKAPCFCEVDFGRKPGKNGKSETTLKAVKVLKPFNTALLSA